MSAAKWLTNNLYQKDNFATILNVHLLYSTLVHTKLILKSKALSHAHYPSDIFAHSPVLFISLERRNVWQQDIHTQHADWWYLTTSNAGCQKGNNNDQAALKIR